MNETIEIEYKGKIYQGSRSITGTRKLFQEIYYGGRSKADGHAYKPHETTLMSHIAKTILRELVQEKLRETG